MTGRSYHGGGGCSGEDSGQLWVHYDANTFIAIFVNYDVHNGVFVD